MPTWLLAADTILSPLPPDGVGDGDEPLQHLNPFGPGHKPDLEVPEHPDHMHVPLPESHGMSLQHWKLLSPGHLPETCVPEQSPFSLHIPVVPQ